MIFDAIPPGVGIRPLARDDIIEQAFYYGQKNPKLSDEFLDDLLHAFQRLVDHPKIGVKRSWLNHRLMRLRMWPLQKFSEVLVFYLPKERGVEIVRVLHSKRDIPAIFDDEGVD